METEVSATEGASMNQHHYSQRSAANRARRAMKNRDELEVQPDGKGKFVIVRTPNKTRAGELKRASAKGRSSKRKATSKRKAVVADPKRIVDRPLSKRAQLLADAEAGKLPPVPNFTAETHAPFRNRLKALVELVKAKDVRGLQAVEIKPYQTSRKAMFKYRNLAVIALKAQAKEARS